jgi:type II secretory pathway component PulK
MRQGAPEVRAGRRARAFVLVAVLVVVMLLSMIAVSLMFRLQAEDTASGAGAGTEQAWAAAMSGVEEAMRVARQARSGSLDWQDAPRLFRERPIYDDGADRWFFTVYSASDPEGRDEVRYGMTDEAGKLNVNQATATNLMKLPRMTRPVAEAIADWVDSDDTPLPDGAEQEYYDALPSPYKVRNGPLASLDELLLVRGVTPALFYGEDANMNFILDANENDTDQSFPPDNGDGKLDLGLRQYLTACAYEFDEDKEGVFRTNLNDPDDPLPEVELPTALTNYIAALRRNKITVAHPAELLEATAKLKDPSGREVEIESGVGKNELPLVLDLFTTTSETRLAGLVNVNTASIQVLAAVPDIDEPLAESIVSARRGLGAAKRQTTAWLYTEGVVPAEVFKKIAPHLTARGFQFSFHCVGYGVPSGRYRVFEAIIDCAGSKPVVIYLRDLTRFGVPIRIDTDTSREPGQQSAGMSRRGVSILETRGFVRRQSGGKEARHGGGARRLGISSGPGLVRALWNASLPGV